MSFKFDFSGFKDELEKHFRDEYHIVTEDLIRYWFIQTHKEKNNCESYTEVPYKRLNGNDSITPLIIKENKPKLIPIIHKGEKESYRVRADLYYGDINNNCKQIEGKLDCVFEFKYHRRTRYSDCCTGTDCGSVFGDLNRLSILDNNEKYFVYIFDDNMYDEYYAKKTKDIFSLFKILDGEQKSLSLFDVKNFDKDIFNGSSCVANKNFGEIKKGAFNQFKGPCRFEDFNYQVKVLYSGMICSKDVTEWGKPKTKSYYLIICQVI